MNDENRNEGLEEIAVIGFAARLPGAEDVRAFWENLHNGVESITFFDDEDLADVDENVRNNPNYVKANAILNHIEAFDNHLFDMTPLEARLTDPQQRLFLECCWNALEHAGYNPETDGSAMGLFGGSGNNTYVHQLLAEKGLVEQVGLMQLTLGNGSDHFTPRVSYLLNLRGPSVPVQTACSTSLVAIHMATQSLLAYECDTALAGGCSLVIPQKAGYTYQEDSILSPDGHCRPFDADAKGTIRGSGVGTVVLKRLDDAIRDGDHVHAVIKGSAINNDGSLKMGYTAPSVEGQRRVIQEALALADVEAESIGYVETHGTATTLGDPIEFEALTQAFGPTNEKQYCSLGAVKSNLGHLDAAAGVTGFIKAVLCLDNATHVPTLHYKNPNPQIDMANSPFYVNTETKPWPEGDGPRRAGVSSFGIGGTNAHVILEEVDKTLLEGRSGESREQQLFVLSAATEASLGAMRENLAGHLETHPDLSPADVAFTLNTGRKALAYRQSFVAADLEVLREALKAKGHVRPAQDRAAEAVFLFPGQGTDYEDMGRELYEKESVFREAVDRCCAILEPTLARNLAELMFAEPDSEDAALLREPAYWQPALFVVGYASARLWISWGIRPKAMMGHSIGEYVAAVLAGTLNLEDGLALLALRGKLTGDVPRGSMMAVVKSEEDLADHIQEPISLAAVNGPSLCILSGPTDAIDALEKTLKSERIRTIRLGATHAFHSSMMEPLMEPLTRMASGFSLKAPEIPFISNVTGRWMTETDALDPAYWARHLRGAVRFSQGLETLFVDEGRIFIEAGPGKVMTNLAKNHPVNEKRFPTIGHDGDVYGTAQVLDALGRAWANGLMPAWDAFYAEEARCRVVLPGYAFDRRNFWSNAEGMGGMAGAGDPLEVKRPLSDWFYLPSWRPSPYPGPELADALEKEALWLFFLDNGGEAEAWAARLESMGQTVVRARIGEETRELEDGNFVLDPVKSDGVPGVLKMMSASGRYPSRIVYAHGLDEDVPSVRDFDNLVRLAQTTASWTKPFTLAVLTRGVQKVREDDEVRYARSAQMGAVRVIPKEVVAASCKAIDLPGSPLSDNERDAVLAEIASGWQGSEIALRGGMRYREHYDVMEPQTGNLPHNFTGKGRYLVINGLQEAGFAIAEHLTGENPESEVVLLDRIFFPPSEEWDAYLTEQGEGDPVSRKIIRFKGLDRNRVTVSTVNPSNEKAMQRFREANGAFEAVFFLDPITDPGLIQTKYAESPSPILSTRLVELEVLGGIVEGAKAVLLFTDNQGESGLGYVEQAAAHNLTHRFVDHMRNQGRPFACIDWGTRAWDDAGIDPNTKDPVQKGLLEKRKLYGMSQAEMVMCIERSWRWGLPRVLISTRDYGPVLDQVEMMTASYFQEQLKKMGGSEIRIDRPDLASEYREPTTETEKFLVDKWQYFFGVDKLGVDDNFFELGGHSLLAVQMLGKVTEHMGVEVPVQELFERPTIAELGAYLDQELQGGLEEDEMAALLAEIEGLSDEDAMALLDSDD